MTVFGVIFVWATVQFASGLPSRAARNGTFARRQRKLKLRARSSHTHNQTRRGQNRMEYVASLGLAVFFPSLEIELVSVTMRCVLDAASV